VRLRSMAGGMMSSCSKLRSGNDDRILSSRDGCVDVQTRDRRCPKHRRQPWLHQRLQSLRRDRAARGHASGGVGPDLADHLPHLHSLLGLSPCMHEDEELSLLFKGGSELLGLPYLLGNLA
jgi:hypothetical protein